MSTRKAMLVGALCCLMGNTLANQQRTNLNVSATVLQVACPSGITALSCAPYNLTTTVINSYDAVKSHDASLVVTEKIQGQLFIITTLY